MTKETKNKIIEGTKHQLWKWVGSLFMEPKTASDGSTVQAASLTKVLTLACFISCTVYWWVRPGEVPDSLVYTLWGMLGVKSVHTLSGAIRAKSG